MSYTIIDTHPDCVYLREDVHPYRVFKLRKGDSTARMAKELKMVIDPPVYEMQHEEKRKTMDAVRLKGDNVSKSTPDVGVMIGRFQVPFLHEGHRAILDFITSRHDKVIVFLGCSELPTSFRNPLDYQARRQMVHESYPNVEIIPLLDRSDDGVWSKQLDGLITAQLTPQQKAVLYGSRDSFISHYTGRYQTQELEATVHVSGTEIRKELTRKRSGASREWREGAIWAASACYPTSYQAVDIAIFDQELKHICLGQKPGETGYRLPGGFSDPCDNTLEISAAREAREETGLEVAPNSLTYLCSKVMDDWRYRDEPHCIKTCLFAAIDKETHAICPGDDLAVAKWVNIKDIDDDFIVEHVRPNHKLLVLEAIEWAEAQ